MGARSPRVMRRITDVVRALWFVPMLMALGGILLGLAMPQVDRLASVAEVARLGWLRTVMDSAPLGAQQLLAAGAGALATILAVAFSLTLVTLQLATAQYTPRVLGRFLDDPVTKVVLGSYIGTVAYLLLVLRSVHGVDAGQAPFVPRLSLGLALVLILACLGLIALFLHHLGRSIEAANLVARLASKTIAGLRRLQRDAGEPLEAGRIPPDQPGRVLAEEHGYVQLVDVERLGLSVPRWVSVVRVEVSAGDYVLAGMPLLSMWPGRSLTRRESSAVTRAIAMGQARTEDQDVLYGVRQLADVALKALSPGLNDETTAVLALNQLGAVLAAASSQRVAGSGWRLHVSRGVAIVTPSLSFRRIVEDALGGVTRFSASHPRVLARILELLAYLAATLPRGEERDVLDEVGDWIEEVVSRGDLGAHERTLVGLRLQELRSPRMRAPSERPHALH